MLDIYIDTREQKPLSFTADIVSTVKRVALPYGDYAAKVNGVKCPIVFERKSLPDLYGTLGKGMTRFKKEINRSIEDDRKLVIIVEKPLKTVVKGYRRSKMKGIAVVRTLFTLMLKHHIPFVLCSNREEMELYITECFNSWGKLDGNRR